MLEIKNLNCYYGKKQVLYDINLCFEKGSFTAITGLNGSGKSTLLSCISGNLKCMGSVCFNEKDILGLVPSERAKLLSYLPQQVKSVPFTVEELVSFGRNPYGDVRGEKAKHIVRQSIEDTGIVHLSQKKVNQLSGGERQLSYFAMLLCQDTPVMLLDEPATGMDIGREDKIYSIAKKKCTDSGKTVVAVMHNLSNAVKFADSIVIMKEGRAVFCGSKKQCLEMTAFEEFFGVKRYECQGETGKEIFFSK